MEWRPIPGLDGYEASDAGEIRSVDRVLVNRVGHRRLYRGTLLAPYVSDDGYLVVNVGSRTDGTRRVRKVHTLVVAAFHGPRPDGYGTRHLNGVKLDCRAANLEYGTWSENAFDSVEHGTHNQASKARCSRTHPLAAPNLRANTARMGHRGCLACNRAAATIRRFALRGIALDFAAVADRHFEAIMNGEARVRWHSLPVRDPAAR